jgi:hypothetical protein
MKRIAFGIIILFSIIVNFLFVFELNQLDLTSCNIEALANGETNVKDCLSDGNGCYNGHWYECYREACW